LSRPNCNSRFIKSSRIASETNPFAEKKAQESAAANVSNTEITE
jgi:hypothetical protein